MTPNLAHRVVYLNGVFIPESEAKLSIYDLSVMQAAAAFEMTRSFHGVHFKLREHIRRLEESCKLLSIPWPLIGRDAYTGGMGAILELCQEVSQRNDHGPGEEHRLLIVVSPGCAEMYKSLDGTIGHPFVYIADFPLSLTTKGFSKYFLEGVHCVTSPIQQVPDACVPSSAKHRSRLHFHLAQQQAPADTWPLLWNHFGEYCEAPGANLVIVRSGKVETIELNCLMGISMQTVKELTGAARGTWLKWEHDIDELWLTGTPFCAVSVVSLDGEPIGDGKIGPVYTAMMEKWNTLVGLNIADQIIAWDQQKVWTPDAQRLSSAHR